MAVLILLRSRFGSKFCHLGQSFTEPQTPEQAAQAFAIRLLFQQHLIQDLSNLVIVALFRNSYLSVQCNPLISVSL